MDTRFDPNTGTPFRKAAGWTGAALAAALLALTGCSSVSSVTSSVGSALGLGGGEDRVGAGCPRVAIVRDAAMATQFRAGSGRDPSDVVSRAQLANITGGCEYGREGVTVNVDLALVAERGPAMQGAQGSYQYFVAIVDPQEQVVAKREFPTTVDFPGNATRSGSKEELQQFVPLPKGQGARDWQVLIGFQLTPDQLEHNRRALKQR